MKNYNLFRVVLLLIAICGQFLAASCQRTEPGNDPAKEKFVLNVKLPEIDRKTAMQKSSAGYKTVWSVGDVISINGHLSEPLEEGGESGASFEFVGFVPEDGETCNLLYPGATDQSVVTIPVTQSREGNLIPICGSGLYPGTISMKNLCAVLRFGFTGKSGDAIQSITVTANCGEKIGGVFNLVNNEGQYSLTPTEGATDYVSIYSEEGVALSSTAEDFYVAIPAGTYSGGFTAKVYTVSDDVMELKFWTKEVSKTLSESKVYEFPDKEFKAGTSAYLVAGTMDGEDIFVELEDGIDGLGSESASFGTTLKVASFNIWNENARANNAKGNDYNSLQWNKAFRAVANCINANSPDVIGLNEVFPGAFFSAYANNIKDLLPDYSWVIYTSKYWPAQILSDASSDTYKNNMGGDCQAVLYKTAKFDKLDSEMMWITGYNNRGISSTYVVPSTDSLYTNHRATVHVYEGSTLVEKESKHWGDTRHCNGVKLRHKDSGKEFWFICTHFDLSVWTGDATEEHPDGYRTAKDMAPQNTNARSLILKAKELTQDGTIPSIIVGDLNTTTGSIPYDHFVTGGGWYVKGATWQSSDFKDDAQVPGLWSDAYEVYSKRLGNFRRSGVSIATMNGKDNGVLSNEWRPDHILVNGFNVVSYGVDRNRYPNADGYDIYPSDHFLIRSIVSF